MKVVFVCLGNICRSPMAEVVFRDLVEKAGLEHNVQIDSAATSDWEQGNSPHQGTQTKLKSLGLSCEGLTSRQLSDVDLDADYIIGMDSQNIADINTMIAHQTKAKICRLLEFANCDRDIADPWYTGDFNKTYDDILVGCTQLLNEIQQKIH